MTIPYRLLAVDVDGTLMDSRNQLPDPNREALHRAHQAGLYVCICTGRSLTETREVLDQLGLDLDAGVFVFGAVVSDLKICRTLCRSPIAPPLAERVVAFFREHDYPVLCLYDADQAGFDYLLIRGRRNANACERWLAMTPTRVHRADQWAPGPNEPLRFSVIEERDRAGPLMAELSAVFPDREIKFNPIYAPNYGFHVVECFAPEVNKWHGLGHLMTRWAITPDQVVAVGDDINDLEMISRAGLGIAMGNAVPRVRQAAAWHAPSHDQGGLSVAIESLLAGRINTSRPVRDT
ncbi:MAG TPA: HAD family hydrolase [Phycisphaerae bacterium]|nr:HAD family hydrolase [Phycisphaerae bacterium]